MSEDCLSNPVMSTVVILQGDVKEFFFLYKIKRMLTSILLANYNCYPSWCWLGEKYYVILHDRGLLHCAYTRLKITPFNQILHVRLNP